MPLKLRNVLKFWLKKKKNPPHLISSDGSTQDDPSDPLFNSSLLATPQHAYVVRAGSPIFSIVSCRVGSRDPETHGKTKRKILFVFRRQRRVANMRWGVERRTITMSSSRSLVRRLTPFVISRLRENQRLLSSSSSSSAIIEESHPSHAASSQDDPLHMTDNCIRVINLSLSLSVSSIRVFVFVSFGRRLMVIGDFYLPIVYSDPTSQNSLSLSLFN